MMSPPFSPIAPSELRGRWGIRARAVRTERDRGLQRDAGRYPPQAGRAHPRLPRQRWALVGGLPARPLPDRAGSGTGRARCASPGRRRTGSRRRPADSRLPPAGSRGGGGGGGVRPRRLPSARLRWPKQPAHGGSPSSITVPNGRMAKSRRWCSGAHADRFPSSAPQRVTRSPCEAAVRQADAIVVGAGPIGLVSALTLARAGLAVDVYEAAEEPGGGCRTAGLTSSMASAMTVCSTVHPLLLASPAFRAIDLSRRRRHAAHARCRVPAHPLDGGRAASVGGSVGDVGCGDARDRPAPPTRGPSSRLRATSTRSSPPFSGRCAPCPRLPGWQAGSVSSGVDLGPPAVPALRHRRGSRRWWRVPAALRHAAAHGAALGVPSPASSPRQLAHRYGWPVVEGGSAAITGRAGRRAQSARRPGRDRSPGEALGRSARCQGHSPRRHTAPAARTGRRSVVRPQPQSAVPLPLRDPVCARSTGPSAARSRGPRSGAARGGDPPYRRDLRGDRPQRGRGGAWTPRRPALLPGDATVPR